ncbi:MAG TPA: PEGA domain-containing protein [Sandaracinaceae bacterium LLY-WYZ-13_1]|nr:PEGA domain-containing protein [Sandaracinaceae bacterium LLY-WYZ-13_1]
MSLRPWLPIFAAALVLTPSPALAQDTWIVLPVGIGEEPAADVRNFVAVSAAGIETRSGVTVLQGPVLRHRLENTVSLPYEGQDVSALATQLAAADETLVRELARQRYDEVIDRATELLEHDDGRSLALQRDGEASLHLGRVCAYRTAAHLQQGNEARAAELAAACYGLVPGIALDERLIPRVHELFERVGRELPSLRVRGSRDDPSGCTIRVNGRTVGQTPAARVPAPPGDYHVQVECDDRPGRVHQVHVDEEDAELVVRASLDAALRTDPPALVYESASALAMLPGDIAEAGRRTGASYAYAIVQQPSSALMRSFRIPDSGPALLLGERTIERTSDPSSVRESASQLARSTLDDPNEDSSNSESTSSISPVGPVLLGVGGAALIAGTILGVVTLDQNSQLDGMCPNSVCPDTPELRDRESEMLTLSAVADALWIGGAAVAAIGLVLTLVLQEEETDARVTAGCSTSGCRAEIEGTF